MRIPRSPESPNLYSDTSAYKAKHFPVDFVHYMRGHAACLEATPWA